MNSNEWYLYVPCARTLSKCKRFIEVRMFMDMKLEA